MKKCVVISDSFKGSLSSEEICEIAKQSFGKIFPACQLTAIPVADGGEGTVACFHEVCGGREVRVTVQGPYGQDMETAYLQLDGGRAVIEMASCAGLPLVSGCKDPCAASTYGVGQQIRHAVQQGNRQILLGLGGSCTNDGGCGCAAALGVRFLDGEGRSFIPVGGTLEREWGTAKFTLYYLSGMILSVLSTVILSLATGYYGWSLSDAYYINLTLFLAFAALYPDAQIMFYMVIPLKAKWLAWADVALFGWNIIRSLSYGAYASALAAVVAILNFVIFFWEDIKNLLGIQSRQRSRQTIQFKSAVRQQKRAEAERGYRHRCEVCGRTDADHPELEFRYCSKCQGYHCFCSDHIFNHQHFEQ